MRRPRPPRARANKPSRIPVLHNGKGSLKQRDANRGPCLKNFAERDSRLPMQWPAFWRRNSPGSALERRLAKLQRAAEFYPTPMSVARDMLELAEVVPEDVVYDLGSGDARIPILAAQEFGCRAVGIEIDPKLYRYSVERVAELGLQDRVSIQQVDFFHADFRPATVVTIYLLSTVNEELQPRMASQLRAGARVVVLDYPIPGWRPETSVQVKSLADVNYTLFLYRRAAVPWNRGGVTADAKNEIR